MILSKKIKDFDYKKRINILNVNFEFFKDLINKNDVENNFEYIISIIQTWQDEKTKQSLVFHLK